MGYSVIEMVEIGRSSSRSAERLSEQIRGADHPYLTARRRIAALAITGGAAMGAVTLYQLGIVKHLPDPPVRGFDSDRLDAAGEAFAYFEAPDGALALANYGGTLVLAATGSPRRHEQRPWLPLAMAAKLTADAAGGVYLTLEQVTKHRALCAYCAVAAVASVAMLPMALPEARAAWRSLRFRRAG